MEKLDVSPQKKRIGSATALNSTVMVKGANSKKVGCKAKTVVRVEIETNLVQVDWHYNHCGHNPLLIDSRVKSALPAPVKKWIKNRIAEGKDWKSIHDLL